MGVRGLATFLKEQRIQITRTFRLDEPQPQTLVVDAWSFLYCIVGEAHLPGIYGGEYDELADTIARVCRAWISLRLAPIFVFDGPYLDDKIPIVARRVQDARIDPSSVFFRTSPAGRSSTGFHASVSMLPSLSISMCIDVLLSLKPEGVECFFADGEADPECAGLAAHYGGYVLALDSDYMVFNAPHEGYIPLDDISWTTPDDGGVSVAEEESDDGFQTVSHSKKRTNQPSGVVHGLIPPEGFESFTVSIYRPEALAKVLKLGAGLLPLLASVLGNDYTPPSLPSTFFPRNMGVTQRVRTVAATIRGILYPTAQNGSRKNGSSRLNSISSADKVTQLINAVVTDLALRELSPLERDRLVDTIRNSIFHYIVPDDFPGPGPLTEVTQVHPVRTTETRIFRRITKAYQRGTFSRALMGMYATGTAWPLPSLEDPDVKASQDIIGGPIRQWIYAVLDDGLPGVGRIIEPEGTTGDEDDEDELIDVAEDVSDSDGGDSDSASFDLVQSQSQSQPEPASPSSELSAFDPLVALRTQLEGLRVQNATVNANGHLQSGTLGGGMAESTTSMAPSPLAPLRGPHFVTEYVRRSERLVPALATVRSVAELLSETESDPTKGIEAQTLVLDTTLPVQLHHHSTRLTLFLRALRADMVLLRALAPHWRVLAASLRWTVVACAATASEAGSSGVPAKGVYRMRWAPSEVRAAIASWRAPRSLLTNEEKIEDDYAVRYSMPPDALSTRSIQLTSQLLAAVENSLELAQALLLVSSLTPPNAVVAAQSPSSPIMSTVGSAENGEKDGLPGARGVSRWISGQRFHWYLANVRTSEGSANVFVSHARGGTGYETEEREEIFRAVVEGLDSSLAEESWVRAAARKTSKAKAKGVSAPVTTQSGKKPTAARGMFDMLAGLGDDY